MSATKFIKTNEDFMSFLHAGDTLTLTVFGAALAGEWLVVSEPQRSGDIPKVLVRGLRKEDDLPFFLHFSKGKLVDDLFVPISNEDNSIAVIAGEKSYFPKPLISESEADGTGYQTRVP